MSPSFLQHSDGPAVKPPRGEEEASGSSSDKGEVEQEEVEGRELTLGQLEEAFIKMER